MHGQFVWYELTTPDVDAAKKFYPRFTGWGTQRFDNDYTMWTTGGVPFAGMFQLSDEMRQQGVPPNWMPYVETDDVDRHRGEGASLGGACARSRRTFPARDVRGAAGSAGRDVRRLQIHGSPGGAWDGTPVVGRFSWHEFMTTDP